MKKFGYCLALLLCAPMVACTTGADAPPTSGPATETPAAIALNADKALYAVEAAYNAPAQAYVTADGKGLLSDATKATVRPILIDAYKGVQVARCAHSFVKLATGIVQGILPSGDLAKCPADARSIAALENAKAEVEGLSARASSLLPK